MELIDDNNGGYLVLDQGVRLGSVMVSRNPCHGRNAYLELRMEAYNPAYSQELFRLLRERTQSPLQVMVDSDRLELTDFLLAGGFELRRRCHEVESKGADYIGGDSSCELRLAQVGEPEYDACAELLYQYYISTHERVSPWTGDYKQFHDWLPLQVFYTVDRERIASVAFVEDNEIAYVASIDRTNFLLFARRLITAMLTEFQVIFFECDDCDWAAMALGSLFTNRSDTSFDTYIYPA